MAAGGVRRRMDAMAALGRMVVFALVVAAVTAAIVGSRVVSPVRDAAAASAAKDPPGWEFLDWADYERFAFPSTPAWRTRDGVVKAMQVRAPVPRASDPSDRQGSYVLWTQECNPARQVVHFERSVFVAGPEYKLGVGLALIRGPERLVRVRRVARQRP